MRKFLLLAMAVFVVLTVAACGDADEQTPLILYQNKVEIDDVLSAYAAAWGEANGVEVQIKTCGGDACGYADQIIAEFNSRNQPDIFVIEGLGQFNQYRTKILGFDGDEEWISDTDVALTVDGTVYGFPINLEGWGMAYNADILAAAGIDPATLTTRAAYQAAFQKLDDMKDELGLNAAVSMAAGPGLTWVTGLHNFNGYLSSGLAYDDNSVITATLAGQPNMDRLNALADWVELLFTYADQTILTQGNYDQMVNAFVLGRVAFIHQGNWIDPTINDLGGIDFEVGYAPHASALGESTGIFVGAPSYYVINKDGNNIDLAKQFLNDMAMTEAGHKYMVEDALMVPAFRSVELEPTAPLSSAMNEWAQRGAIYAWWQNDLPPGFGMGDLGPVYELFARGEITKATFVTRMANEIRTLE